MNYLAHIYLSGENDLVKIGNFMADGIHGKKIENFQIDIQKGIILHRFIDTYTDAHPVFRESTKRLHSNYHHYSGIIVDIIYDHFLAKNWSDYSDEKLDHFINRFYNSLNENFELLTTQTQQFMPYMISQNWLLSYQTIEGIEAILTQMDARMKRRNKQNTIMRFAVAELQLYYTEFETEFRTFFKEITQHTKLKLQSL